MITTVLHAHLGLGDMLINNALVRNLAKTESVIVLCKYHNVASCSFMWHDEPNIFVQGIENDQEAIVACKMAALFGHKVVRNGLHKLNDTFDIAHFDSEFYRHADVPFEQSWDGWKVPECNEMSPVPTHPYSFIHQDVNRGFRMNSTLVGRTAVGLIPVFSDGRPTNHIFEWIEVLRNATEIHVMESCFAILVDRLDGIKARRLCVHAYMRNSIAPTYKKAWEILT